jgi:hypothetical protein
MATGLGLAAAGPAQAATLTLTGSKDCYRAGDELTLNGTGFTPGAPVDIVLGGLSLGAATADSAGNLSAPVTIGTLKGVSRRTVTATDAVNPANVGVARFLGAALNVSVRPKTGTAGRRLRINASGFTTGRRLYAHAVRKGYRRNYFIGRLKGPCRTLKTRRVVLPASTPTGVYTVQFDTRRRYSTKTKVWVKFTVTVGPRGAASAAFQPRLTQTVLFSR